MLRRLCGMLALALLSGPPSGGAETDAVRQGLERLYNFDFAGARGILDSHIRANPSDPLGYAFRGAVFLFQELDRLGVLEAEFFADDKRIIEKKKLKPDPAVRDVFYRAIEDAERLAEERLTLAPSDRDATFAMCVTTGLVTDYVSLIEKRQFRSLSWARKSHNWALRLLDLDPNFHDAYLTTGLSEYLIGSLPFFVRWFVRFEQAEGDKALAVRKLELVAGSAGYFGPFAKILLSLIHLREKRPEQCERLLKELVREFPENPLFRKELTKLSAKLASGELSPGGSR